METQAYIILALAVALYALFLERFKHHWEPHFTWLEVVLGVVMCLAVPAYLLRVTGDGGQYERWTWAAFGVGGGIIIAWQLMRMFASIIAVQREAMRLFAKGRDYADAARPLAEQSGTEASADARDSE